jgi:uncharacterized protein (TIGR02687 family)
MTDRISASLARLFESHRIVFWYDTARDMRAAFDGADLEGVTKLEIANNAFSLKYRMLRQEPQQKFLLYHDGPAPEMTENWLLDVQLATAVFKADQAAIWLSELGLPQPFEEVVRDHLEFYRANGRIEDLKRLMQPGDTKTDIRRRMLAVCVGADGALDTVVEALLGQLAKGHNEGMQLIERANLAGFFWKQLGTAYGYQSDSPDFEDFAICLFNDTYRLALGEDAKLNPEALVLFRRWKNSKHSGVAFETLSKSYQSILKIPQDLEARPARSLTSVDHFEEIDRHVIRSLVHAMSNQTLGAADVLRIVRERRHSHWYASFEDVYQAISAATEFQQALGEANLSMSSPEEGIKRYVASWYRLDQLYRKFIHHMQKSGQATLLGDLFTTIENRYTTSFLSKVNDAWQDQIAGMAEWRVRGYPMQSDFYRDQAAEYRRRDQKVVVIISDALRYEVAEECLREIRKLDKFEADLKPMISMLPSYTQLGMAALLPNKDLTLLPDGNVSSFGDPAIGTPNREKLLAKGRAGDRVKAMKASAFMELHTQDGKVLFRDHDVLYLYHNRIDAAGDDTTTESRVFEEAEKTIEDLTRLVRKLTSANVSNILITADHGFLYQHRPLHETDFSSAEPSGKAINVRPRRFVIGEELTATAGMKHFTPVELGLAGDLEVLIPNSIHRLRVKGAGSRYVHGGASLQEIVIPVLRVGKSRASDVQMVEVQIIASTRNLISSGQHAVTLYQAQPVSEKLQPRALIAGLYSLDGTLISDEHPVMFDYRADNPREREMPLKFLLSRDADAFNGQDVLLKLRMQIGKTSHFEDYQSQRYELRRGITTDFDF